MCLCCPLQGDTRGIKLYGLFVVILMMPGCSLTLWCVCMHTNVFVGLNVLDPLFFVPRQSGR